MPAPLKARDTRARCLADALGKPRLRVGIRLAPQYETRHAIPEANPSLYVGMSLGLTFPFNILLGIPLYVGVAQRVLG